MIELFKVFKAILIMNAVDANYQENPEMQKDLGNIKFSILVQEIISIALMVPILSIGRFIFFGFSIRNFDAIFDQCLMLQGLYRERAPEMDYLMIKTLSDKQQSIMTERT